MSENFYPKELYISPGGTFSNLPYGTYSSVTVTGPEEELLRRQQGLMSSISEAIAISGEKKKTQTKKPGKQNIFLLRETNEEQQEERKEEADQEVLNEPKPHELLKRRKKVE